MSTSFTITPFLATPGEPALPVGRQGAFPSGRQSPGWHRVVWRAVVAAYRRHRSRQLLSQLDAHMLKDIGVSFAEAEHEANKPFWQV